MKPFDLEQFKAGKPALEEGHSTHWVFIGVTSRGIVVAENIHTKQVGQFNRNGEGVNVSVDLTHMAPQKVKMTLTIPKVAIEKAQKDGITSAICGISIANQVPNHENQQVCIEVEE